MSAPAALAASRPVEVAYLWNLSTETGPVRTSGFSVWFDAAASEVYVTGESTIRIFNETGMEVFRFTPGAEVGFVKSAAALANGEILLLGYREGEWSLTRASYRGAPVGRLEPKGVPPEFLRGFRPSVVAVRGETIYLADLNGMRVLVTAEDGTYVRSHDLAALLGFDEQKRADTGLAGFGVDVDGGVLFTIAPLFTAHALSPTGELRAWGRPGGRPGDFNVVAGIAADDRHYFVADARKSAVIVFDRESLSFEHEFGYRNSARGGLVSPSAIAVGAGHVYVSQNASRGISVYAVKDGFAK